MKNIQKRVVKSAMAGGVGYLGGLLLENGIESLTGIDFIDGVMEVAGLLVGVGSVNRDMIEAGARQIELRFGVPPEQISEEQWLEFKKAYPRYAHHLEKALQVK